MRERLRRRLQHQPLQFHKYQHNHVHKVILAGASKFFREQLCKANVMVPVIIRLEDFGIDVSSEALGYIIEFAYR